MTPTSEYHSEFRDYHLTKIIELKSDTVSELSYVAPPFNLNGHNYNTYDGGNCTAGIASWMSVPNNLGNAADWGANAAAQGKPVSDIAVPGAVGYTTRGYYGHVVLAIQVVENQVLVQEENVYGLGVIDQHWYAMNDYRWIYF